MLSTDIPIDESNTQSTSAVTDDASFRAMFKTIFPSITDWAIDVIEKLYPTDDYSSQGLRFSAAKQHYDIPGKVCTPFYLLYWKGKAKD